MTDYIYQYKNNEDQLEWVNSKPMDTISDLLEIFDSVTVVASGREIEWRKAVKPKSYVVEMRIPKKGDQFFGGGGVILTANGDGLLEYPVIIEEL